MSTYESLLSRVTAAPGAPGTEVTDPATGEVIGTAPAGTTADVDTAVATAVAARAGWAGLSDDERRAALLAAADAVDAHAEPLAMILSREAGKPLNGLGARFEVASCAGWLRATAALDLPTETVLDDETGHATLGYRPVGTVGVITPWNWPMVIAVWQLAPALRMGNTVVAKPSEHTTLSGLALFAVLNDVLPPGVLNPVTGGGEVGDALVRRPEIGKVMFTGSTAMGAKIARAAADNVTRLTLELGGNDAAIVLPDVDPAAVAEGLFWGAFINGGQNCAAIKRLYVHDDVHDAVVDALAAVAAAVPMGVGTDESSVLGPLQNAMQFDVVDRLVEDAKARGARVVLGGDPDREAPGYFYPTTLVTEIADDAPLVQEEQFGPALPIVRYSDVEKVVAQANAVDAGLGASVWSADRDAAAAIAQRIEAGTVWINGHGSVNPFVPFGGVKKSGYGLEFGVEGLKSVAVPQVIYG